MTTATRAATPAALFHGPAFVVDPLRPALDAEAVAVTAIAGRLADLDAPDAPTVLVVDDDLAAREPDIGEALGQLPDAVAVLAIGRAAEDAVVGSDRVFMSLPAAPGTDTLLRALRAGFRHAAVRIGAARAEARLRETRSDIRELNQIGMALMTERDPDRLLVKILDQALRMTHSDAGSLYLVEKSEEGADRLRFKLSENRSITDLQFVEFTLPIDRTSIAGHVADTSEPLVLDDAYGIAESAPYSFNPSFDERFGYRTRSMLVVPMADHRGEVVGVLQLINRKRDPEAVITSEAAASDHVLPYGDHDLALVRGLAGQAAVSIENSRLYQQIQDIFEAFVKAAVAAIDQRDPTTAGHSVRVATLTCDLARLLPRTAGRWADTRLTRDQMRELRYAALLHDFGKVGVREEVLVKAKKLPPHLWERVQARLDFIQRTLEKEHLERKLLLIRQGDPGGADGLEASTARLDRELADRLRRLETFREGIQAANEPSILPEAGAAILQQIAAETFENVVGEEAPYLDEDELAYLSIPKGSLDARERLEIESHVTQTYRFLTQIPWTDDLGNLAEIAYGHHEKLDGRGYPRGVHGEEIPVQTRIMTIADIFDALTASDRPYKRALAADRALDILRMEAKDGMLDSDLVELLISSNAYEVVLTRDWREL